MNDNIIGKFDNPCYAMDINIRIKEETLRPTAELIFASEIIGKPELVPLPVVMTVIHDMIVDIANKTGQSFNTILKDMKEVQNCYPQDWEDKIIYELR